MWVSTDLRCFSGPGLRRANLTFCTPPLVSSTVRSQVVFSLTSFSFPSQLWAPTMLPPFLASSSLGLEIKFQVSTHLGHSVSFTPLPYPTHDSKGILNMCRAFFWGAVPFIRGLSISDYAILYAILVDLKCFIFSRLQFSHLRLFLQVCLCKAEVMNMCHPLSSAEQGSSIGYVRPFYLLLYRYKAVCGVCTYIFIENLFRELHQSHGL